MPNKNDNVSIAVLLAIAGGCALTFGLQENSSIESQFMRALGETNSNAIVLIIIGVALIIGGICIYIQGLTTNVDHVFEGDLKKCPHCAEIIKKEATVCKHCGREMLETHTTTDNSYQLKDINIDSMQKKYQLNAVGLMEKFHIEYDNFRQKYIYKGNAYKSFDEALKSAEKDTA